MATVGRRPAEARAPGRRYALAVPLAGYLASYAAAEALTLSGRPLLALYLHALLLLTLVVRSHFTRGAESELHVALSVAPFVRLLPLTLPLAQLPGDVRLPLAGSLLLLATLLAARTLRYRLAGELGLNLRALPFLPLVAAAGVPLGLLTYLAARPPALTATLDAAAVLGPAASLLVFSGFAEELFFRGLLLTAAIRALGAGPGIVLTALLYALAHLPLGTWELVALPFAAGLAFGWVAWRLRSVTGLALAHGLANGLLLIVLPHVLP